MALQAAPQQQAPLGLLFDSSLDGGIDQVLALAMLFHLQASRRIRLASISTGRFNLKNVAFLDAVARFYSGGQGDDYGPARGLLPVGMSTAGTQTDVVPAMISAALTRIGADGQPVYRHSVTDFNDTADAAALIRNALTAFHDENAAVVLAGSPANLLAVLALPDGVPWASMKARVLSVAGGRFDGGPADPAVRADVAGFRKLLADWPTPIVMAGTELNDALPFPGNSLEAIATWAPEHPVVDAYRAYKPMPYDAPTQAMAAVLHAVSPEENHFAMSEPGTISILDDGRTQFSASPAGRHRYLIARPEQKESVLRTYVQLVTEQPPAPPARGR